MAYRMGYDEQSFKIHEQRMFIHSAAIHYFRFPRSEWREVLWKAKLAGITCIDTYFAWNIHEPHEGEWNFEGNADIDAFLSLCEELGLMVIARPGPYICAEWDFGGFPWWLNNKGPMSYRAYDENFLKYVDRYFDKLIPIIARHQSTRGGNVVLVQVENEYQHLGSDEEGRDYLNYLRDGMINRGIDVPLISCEGGVEGAIECANFWSGADHAYAKLRKKQPDTPKIVTEFWTGWFERWGGPRANHKTADLLERRIMEALRAGFTGLNHYMFCGGTNFGPYAGRTVDASDVFNVTSYDYDAPLGEYLNFTPKYHVVKKLGYFIQSIHDVLTSSTEVETQARLSREGVVRKRVHGDTTLYFIEHTSDERDTVHLTTEDDETFAVTVNPGQIVPVIKGLPVLSGWSLTYNSFLGGYHEVGGMPTLVVYADEGQRSLLKLSAAHKLQVDAPASVQVLSQSDDRLLELDLCHFAAPQVIRVDDGEQQLRIIVLSSEAMDEVWWLHEGGTTSLVIGADGIHLQDGKLRLETASLLDRQVRWFGDAGLFAHDSKRKLADGSFTVVMHGAGSLPAWPILSDWEVSAESLGAASGSVLSQVPLSFSAMEQDFGHLLYSAVIHSDEARQTTLVMPHTQDPVRVFVNGVHCGILRNNFGTSLPIQLEAGDNRIDLLVQQMGRFNFSFYLGESKGIFGPVYIDGGQEDLRSNWKTEDGRLVHLQEVNRELVGTKLRRTITKDGWDHGLLVGELGQEVIVNGTPIDLGPYRVWYKIGTIDLTPYLQDGENTIEMTVPRSPVLRLEVLKWNDGHEVGDWQIRPLNEPQAGAVWTKLESGHAPAGPAWYRTSFKLPQLPEDAHVKCKLRLTGLSKGVLWLNGHNVGRYWQIGPQEDYKIPLEWLRDTNELLIFDETGASPESIEFLWENVAFVR